MISEYIKKKDGTKIGLMVATTDEFNGVFSIGWSVCNIKKDKFNKTAALNIALTRAKSSLCGKDVFYTEDGPRFPSHIEESLRSFFHRTKTYYKDKKYVSNYVG